MPAKEALSEARGVPLDSYLENE